MVITAIRTVIIYIFIIVALRITGKRQIGELQPIELVVTLLISDLAVIPMQESEIPLISGLIPIVVLVALELILSTLMMKSNSLSKLISGNPVVIIQDGKLQQKALRQLRLGVDDLTEALRQQGVFDLHSVEYAVVETNGKISIFQRVKNNKKETAAVPVVNDGQAVAWGLDFCHLTPQWLEETLVANRCSMDTVLLMTADRNGKVSIIQKENFG
jgi:uncharacterized membrane protein YcaP (DUF421 family)